MVFIFTNYVTGNSMVNIAKVNDNTYKVVGETNESYMDKRVSMIVLNPNCDIDEVSVSNMSDGVYHLAQEKIGMDGRFEFTINIDDANIGGRYAVYTTVESDNNVFEREKAFFYVLSELKKSTLLEKINSSYSKENMEAFDELKIYISDIPKDGNAADFIYNTLIEQRNSAENKVFSSADEMIRSVRIITLCKLLIDMNCSENTFETMCNEIGIEVEKSRLSILSSQKDVIAEYVKKKGISETTIKNLIPDNIEKHVIWLINAAGKTDIKSILEKYNEEIWLDKNEFLVYCSLSKEQQMMVNSKLVNRDFLSLVDFKNFFTNIISDIKNLNDGKNIPSGGGARSGGGGGKPNTVASPIKESEDRIYYKDLDSVEWAKDAIMFFSEKGYVNGYGKNEFKPEFTINREEFVKIITNVFSLYAENAECEFLDVEKDMWYYPYIASAFSNGIVNGVNDETFGINEKITRQDIAVMISRACEKTGILLSGQPSKVIFDDEDEISEYALKSIKELSAAGILTGFDNKIRPKSAATRAEAVVILYRILKKF